MQVHKSIVRVESSTYILNKTCYTEFLDTPSKVDAMQKWTNSDIVFSNGYQLFFCSNIEDADIVEESVTENFSQMITECKVVQSDVIVPEYVESDIEIVNND